MGEASDKKPRRARRRILRARVSPGEKALCALLLLAIPTAGWAVYRAGQRYDPHLYSLDPALVGAMKRRMPMPNAATADAGEDGAGVPNAAAPAANAYAVPGMAPSAEGMVPVLPGFPGASLAPAPIAGQAPAGASQGPLPPAFGDPSWEMGKIEQFGPDNLYEKINGKSEQYLKYSFARLHTACYTDRRDPSRFLDAFVYDMSKPADAFGIYSVERPRNSQAVSLGDEGYRAGASFFFIQGRHYVQVVPSDKGAVFQDAGLKLARAIADRLAPAASTPAPAATTAAPPTPVAAAAQSAPKPTATPHPAPRATTAKPGPDFSSPKILMGLFPKEEMVANASEYLKEDALGLEFLTDVFISRYRVEGKDYTVFLTHRDDPASARLLVDKYIAFLQQFGKVADQRNEHRVEFVVGEMAGFTDLVFQAGPFLGGVNAAPNRAVAERLAVRLLRSLGKNAAAVLPPESRNIQHWPAPAAEEEAFRDE